MKVGGRNRGSMDMTERLGQRHKMGQNKFIVNFYIPLFFIILVFYSKINNLK